MIKNISKLEVKIGERIYTLLCECDSPLGEVHDSLSSMKGFIIQKIQEAEKRPQEVDNVQHE
jgi:hypothetical protein